MFRQLAIFVVCLSFASAAVAQEPGRGGRGGEGGRGNGFGGNGGDGGRGGDGAPGLGYGSSSYDAADPLRRRNPPPGMSPGMSSPGRMPPSPMFDAIDADGDGTITTRELRRAVVALKKLDADGDGNLTRDEALAPPPMGGMPSRDPGRGGPDAEVEAMMRHDRNGDGRLTEDEVPPQLAQQLAGADANGDGAIDRIELQAALSNPQRGGDPRQGPDMMQYDRNRDGQLSPDEVPTNLRGMLRGSDADANGKIDASELQSIQQRLNERARGGRRLPPGMEIGPGGLQRNGE